MSVLVFWSRVSHFSFLVFQFLVFSYSSPGFVFLVPRSQFDTTRALLSPSIYTFFSPFSLLSVGSFLSLSSAPQHFDVHLWLMSWMGLRGPWTHAGFRWCASSIGSVSTVLLLFLVVGSEHSSFLLVSDSSLVGAGDNFWLTVGLCRCFTLIVFLPSSLSSGLGTHCSFSSRIHLG